MLDRSNYEKITDDIMVLANKFVLKMNVALSFYNNDNKRINFHREVEYYSQKAYKNLINILLLLHTKQGAYRYGSITRYFNCHHRMNSRIKLRAVSIEYPTSRY